jgi:hypothetical protein
MAVGVRSSSSMWSSLRSISSRRRRISERRSSEVMTSPQQEALAGGACPARALVGRAELNSALHSAVVGEVCCFLCFSHITFRPISVSRSDHARGLVRSRQRFVRWSQRQDKTLAPHHCWLTNRIKAPAAINRASRIPATSETTQCRLGLTSFDPAPFCAAPRPNQKRSLSIAVSAVIGAAL